MFVFVTALLLSLVYVFFIKFVYYKQSVIWQYTLNKITSHLNIDGIPRFSSTQESPRPRLKQIAALLVTAHPDDECMFFAPTIINLVESRADVYLLCLSTGNYNNQGAQRKKELLNSCAVLGIPANLVTVIDHKDLPDDPSVLWSTALISSLVLKHIQKHNISMVLTFDERGVSGHANHIAIHKSLSYLASSGRLPEGCQFFSLDSINILRKYLSVLEVPISWLLPSDFCSLIGRAEYTRAKKAMLCHRSQLLWFRRLYILFSSYMFVNTFHAVTIETKNVKIY
ncbi:hypothetical protein DNTS_011368 [Danionella cerebrum]|uniref:N-acetylglucosaminylphosphatidylinositol deacetylase n=1 Tax=Danionella cerebrum TaxID=2873325 RepID=A0A553QXB1_9TELE|nr:hypothetical protein DNTS_011368 [Danionella translucida]